MQLLTIYLAGFASVFLLGFQSRNVNSGHYGWAAGTSFFIAVSQAAIWTKITAPAAGVAEVIAYGLSGSTGITAAMWVHKRLHR